MTLFKSFGAASFNLLDAVDAEGALFAPKVTEGNDFDVRPALVDAQGADRAGGGLAVTATIFDFDGAAFFDSVSYLCQRPRGLVRIRPITEPIGEPIGRSVAFQ